MIFFILFAEFFKIGLFAVGGGLATIPFLSALTSRYDWITMSDLATMIAIAEATPGAIGVNIATYAGFNCAGIPGAVIATLGLVSPSIIIITIIAGILRTFKDNPHVQAVFAGLRPAATGLIGAAGFGIVQQALFYATADSWYGFIKWRDLLLFVSIFMVFRLLKKTKLGHPVFCLAAAAALGVVLAL
ncbi:MAG: chromate transporter [Spirochaetaceae bacterium]|jgi:chromate transporter|nr:chromate transporter [Spirochaetaceae bacterium]